MASPGPSRSRPASGSSSTAISTSSAPSAVVKIDPAPRYGSEVADDELDGREKVPVDQRCRNGSVLNAPARLQAAWDSGIMNYYAPEARARLPIAMKPGDSLASSISLKPGEKVTYPYHAGTVRGVEDNSPVKIIAVLTCVAGPLPPDAFRPGYSGHDTKIYLARDLKRDLLPHFDQPADAPDPVKFAELRPAPLVRRGFLLLRRAPEQHAQLRPGVRPVPRRCRPPGLLRRHEARGQGAAAHQRHPDRHRPLRADPPGPSRLARPRRPRLRPQVPHRLRRRHARRRSHGQHQQDLPQGRIRRGRADRLRRLLDRRQGRLHRPLRHRRGHRHRPRLTSAPAIPGDPTSTCHPIKWVPEQFRSDAYRRANTSTCFVAQALVLRAMKLERAWNHDAFFDYVDRWMFEDDKPFRIEIAKYCQPPYSKDDYLDESKDWFHEGYADQPWVKQLWTKYRPLCPAPTDGWKQKHDDSYYLNAVEKQRKK